MGKEKEGKKKGFFIMSFFYYCLQSCIVHGVKLGSHYHARVQSHPTSMRASIGGSLIPLLLRAPHPCFLPTLYSTYVSLDMYVFCLRREPTHIHRHCFTLALPTRALYSFATRSALALSSFPSIFGCCCSRVKRKHNLEMFPLSWSLFYPLFIKKNKSLTILIHRAVLFVSGS